MTDLSGNEVVGYTDRNLFPIWAHYVVVGENGMAITRTYEEAVATAAKTGKGDIFRVPDRELN